MSASLQLEELERKLQEEHNFSEGSISFLSDKGFVKEDFQKLYEAMKLPDETFAERRNKKSSQEKIIDAGDSEEITTGRYNRYVKTFKEISSEQALVRGRMKFAIEYVISLADLLSNYPEYSNLVKRPFSEEEKQKLRGIYKSFRTKDYIAAKTIEDKTNHDIVAANTWATIRAQQFGLDDKLMRGLTHLARTSDDVNANVVGELYMGAIGQWASSIVTLLSELEKRAVEYADVVCIGETHGQDAQLTTLGHIYANLLEQIKQHAKEFLGEDMLKLDGKIAGAIGTDVDMKVAFPNVDPAPMYRSIVENIFGLKYIELGNDQSCSNAALSQSLDALSNVNLVVKKAAADTWVYTSRGILAKKTKKGESGSSVMPQKTNPYLAEGCEALISIANDMFNPIKESIVAYREQGDLRRSSTLREGFHPIMLSIIAIERLTAELKNYEPDIITIENEIYQSGPKIISSAINTYLRGSGIPDAYDRLKDIVMKPYVKPEEIESYIEGMVTKNEVDADTGRKIKCMLYSVMDNDGLMEKLSKSSNTEEQKELIGKLTEANRNEVRKELVGDAITSTYKMVEGAKETEKLLLRYVKSQD